MTTSTKTPMRTSANVSVCAEVLLTSAPVAMSASAQTDSTTRAYNDRLRLTGADRPWGRQSQVDQVRVLGAARADAGRIRRMPVPVAREQHRAGNVPGHRLRPGVWRRWIVGASDEKDRWRAADREALERGPRPHRPEGALQGRVLDERAEDRRSLGQVRSERVVGGDVGRGVEVHAHRPL